MKYYIKPKSLTWWMSMSPIVSGCIVALSASVPYLVPAANVIDAYTGGMSPMVMVNGGLIAVGMRAAL